MLKRFLNLIVLSLFAFFLSFPAGVLADKHLTAEPTPPTEEAGGANPGTPTEATYKGRCSLASVKGSVYEEFPACANSPNECSSNAEGFYPLNCFFLGEPIGGKTGYDLFKRVQITHPAPPPAEGEKAQEQANPCDLVIQKTGDNDENLALQAEAEEKCEEYKAQSAEEEGVEEGDTEEGSEEAQEEEGDESGEGPDALQKGKVTYNYELWYGEYLVPGLENGPYQAILVYEPGKDYQGPLGLLYNYLALVYNYVSGFILGLAVLIGIGGGIEMIASNGNAEQFGKGQGHIVKALIGIAVWFLASVILYTINPTFFLF